MVLGGSVNEFGGRAGLEVACCHSGRHDVMDEMDDHVEDAMNGRTRVCLAPRRLPPG